MKKITLSIAVAAVMSVTSLFAQSVEQGKKFYYYERFNSAKAEFEKALASNPNDVIATYWLGQTLLQLKDTAGAKALYQKGLTTSNNAPAMLVGMGQIELNEGKKDDARQRFETALNLTKNKDVNIMAAIGHAIVDSKTGDAQFVIEKLTPVTQTKDFKSPEVWTVIGDAYRKLGDGGSAVQSYQKALNIDPKYAGAEYRIAKLYMTQQNKDVFLPALEQSVQMDPSFAPAYYELYYYWFNRDINKAKDFYERFMAVSDPDPNNDYEKTSIIFASGSYDNAITTAKGYISAQGDKADPRYYKLIAYAYDAKKDSVNAKNYLDQYFAKQKAENFVPKDYAFKAELLSKFPGNETQALQAYEQAINADTSRTEKIELMNSAAALSKKLGNRAEEAKWLGKIYYTDPKSTKTDLYNYGYAYYQAKVYDSSVAIFGKYKEQYPDEIYGYLWSARSYAAVDTTMEKGLAVPDYQKFIEVAKKTDSVKLKGMIVQSLFYLASYSNDIKKDKNAAIDYLQQVVAIDPTNTDASKFIEILKKPAKQPSAAPQKKTTGNSGTSTKTPGGHSAK
jgi:tetratricopeptide (TPR) repeat protein